MKMKKVTIPVCLAAILAFGGCSGNQGSGSAASDSTTTTTTTESGSANSSTAAATDTNNAASAGAASAAGTSSSADTSMGADQAFIMDAASGGLMEVTLGKTASTVAASSKVKQFGQMMVTDHTKANSELKAVAAKKNITVPPTPMEKHQMHITELQAKKGADFDKAYVDMMVDDHKEDVSKFEEESTNGKDADVKAFATKTLPVLRKHLAAVQAIQAGMNK